MRSAYVLAKITPHAGTYRFTGINTKLGRKDSVMGKNPTRPGKPEGFIFSVEEAGFATAPLPPGVSDLIFCKYGHGTDHDQARLVRLVNEVVVYRAHVEGWPIAKMKQDTLKNVVKTAVMEALSSGTCNTCKGVKAVITKNENGTKSIDTCPECDGTGYARISMRTRAYLIGINHETFRRSWKKRYNYILTMLTDWENEASWVIFDRTRSSE